ncbi:DUF6315 family protein [Amycolatopsis sp. FU40]|uniref:DUF6315 family protein n=1 Tax=Amycolatopsis sp. FU40 TaxID=2914159 RepID=UPI001F39BDAC|nr:DUF6315 family protein [Amycolatopsis sp. FU40]UKD51323.1 DUF6315 family protein [Amycolatopsis sp. FU40]
MRKVSDWDNWGEASPTGDVGGESAYGRCYVWRKCAVCGTLTQHAYLRDDEDRDEAERAMLGIDAARAAELVLAGAQIAGLVQWLEEHAVRVEWRDLETQETSGMITRYLDDGAYAVLLDRTATTLDLVAGLEQAVRIVQRPERWMLWFAVPSTSHGPPYVYYPLRADPGKT